MFQVPPLLMRLNALACTLRLLSENVRMLPAVPDVAVLPVKVSVPATGHAAWPK